MGLFSNVSQWFEKTGISDVFEKAAPYVAPLAIPGIGSMIAGLPGIGITGGSAIAGAGVSAAFGGDPKKGAIMGGLNQILGSFGPDTKIGKFVRSPIGNTLLSGLLATGGDFGQLGGLLNAFGLKGRQKDFVETILAVVALAGISDVFAKDAIETAQRLEARETKTIDDILAAGKELMPTTEQEEREIGVQLENVAREFGRAREAFIARSAQTGMARGGGLAGQLRRLSEEEALGRLGAERAVQLQRPQRTLAALQAQASVLPFVRGQAEQARTRAEEMRRFPFEIATDIMAAQRPSPLEEYLAAQQAGVAGGGAGGGGFQLGDLGLDLSQFGLTSAAFPYAGGEATQPGIEQYQLPSLPADLFPAQYQLPTYEGLPMRMSASQLPTGTKQPTLSTIRPGTPNLPFR